MRGKSRKFLWQRSVEQAMKGVLPMLLRLAEKLRKSRAEENMDTEEVLARHHKAPTEYVAAPATHQILQET